MEKRLANERETAQWYMAGGISADKAKELLKTWMVPELYPHCFQFGVLVNWHRLPEAAKHVLRIELARIEDAASATLEAYRATHCVDCDQPNAECHCEELAEYNALVLAGNCAACGRLDAGSHLAGCPMRHRDQPNPLEGFDPLHDLETGL